MTIAHYGRPAQLAMLTIVLAASCRSGPVPNFQDVGPPDAGRDAGPPRDAAVIRDVGHDVDRDAHVDPGWRLIDGFDPRCAVRMAADAEAAIPSLHEHPCADTSGCRELTFPVLPSGAYVRIDGIPNVTRWDSAASTGYFWWFVVDFDHDDFQYALSDASGTTHAAFAASYAETCVLSQLGSGDGRFAFDAHPLDDPGGASIGTGLIASPLEFVHVATINDSDMPGQATQYMPVMADAVVLNTTGGAQLWHVSAEGTPTRLEWGGATAHYVDDVQGDAVFTTELGDPTFVSVSIGAEPVVPFVTPADGSDAFGLRTDGVSMVWKQGYDRIDVTTWTRVEIWTAPYTTDPASIAPRRLSAAQLPVVHHFMDAFGPAVVDMDTDAVRYVVHFLDGSPDRELRMPTDRTSSLLFAGPEEVGVLIETLAPQRLEAVRFYRYDALPLVH